MLVGFSDSLENKLNTQGTIGDPNMDEAYRLYQAALERTPDTPGLGAWTAQLDSGISPLQVAQGFVSSNEFAGLFAGLEPRVSLISFITMCCIAPPTAPASRPGSASLTAECQRRRWCWVSPIRRKTD